MPNPIFSTPVTNPFSLTDVGGYANLTLADIDGDGDLDAFVGNNAGYTLFFRNTGTANAPSFIAPAFDPFGLTNVGTDASTTLADIDGDGDLDAFVGNAVGNTLFFRNTGTGTAPVFSAPATNPFGLTDIGNYSRPTFADIDGDGDLDAFVGNFDGNTLFYRNTASAGASAPIFSAPATNPFGLTDVGTGARPTFADVDGDGDLDAFVGNSDGNTLFFRNTASAGATAPIFSAPQTNPFGLTDLGDWASPTFSDIDGDGDLDAFVGNNDGNTRFFLNKMAGVRITQSGGRTAVTEGGVNDDAYTVVLNSAPTANVTITLNNTNNQATTSVTSLTFTSANWNVPQTVNVSAVDDRVGEGAHTGGIQHLVTSADTAYHNLAAAAVRVAITDNDLPQRDPVFGTATTNPFGLTDVGSFASPTLADIDGDGDLDAFVGNIDGNTVFYRNTASAGDTAPVFSAPQTNPFGLTDVGQFASPTFADIDGDGDLDAFVGERYGNTLFYRNTASAGATAPSFSAPQTNPFGLTNVGGWPVSTFADIDGDGDLDAFVGNYDGNSNALFYRNTANAGATAPVFSAPQTNPFGLRNEGDRASRTFSDIDGDGDLDAFVGNFDGNTVFYRNTASAGATSPIFSARQTNPFGLTDVGSAASHTLADIDGDGDLDAFVGNSSGNTRFYLNTNISNWSALSNGQTLVFDPQLSVLRFDSSAISAARVVVTPGNPTTLAFGGKTVTLQTDVKTLTTTNVTFANGSLLIVGDNTSGTANDDAANKLSGGAVADQLIGLGGNDTLLGAAGNDLLDGGLGNDNLNGGFGVDTMAGGAGDDIYTVDKASDVVTEAASAGTDQINSSLTRTLPVNVENHQLTGGANINSTGNTANNSLDGNEAANKLNGLSGNDALNGEGGDDTLTGALTTTPFGKNEIDMLTGGIGSDRFVLGITTGRLYDNGIAASPGQTDYALITDFNRVQADILQLEGSASQYLLGTSPIAGVTGNALYHDTNGNGTLQTSTDELIAIIRSPAALTAANTINTAVFV